MNHEISKEIFKKAQKYIPGGVNSPVRAFKSVHREAPIFACKGEGAKIWDEEEGLLNQHLFKVTPYDGFCREYVLQSILKTLDEFRNLTTGSTMKHIQRGKLKQVFVKVPSPKIMDEYKKYADTIRRQILVLSHKIILLNEARDRLLPQLMSGEIEL